MPNAINPNDYNIDNLNTNFLGNISAEDFRNYLFSNNLQNLPPELVDSPAGNFSSYYNEKGVEKSINYGPVTNPGDLDEWTLQGNFTVNLNQISYQNPSQNVGTNQYGPPTIQPYNEPNLVPDETGYIQYPTSVPGGVTDFFKDQLLNEQLNLGPGSAINFDSPLNDIAKERRKEEALNKLKLKGQNQVLGKLNLDPFGLLAGQDLILKDYDITVRPGVGGKIFDFITDFAGVQIPTSPIPNGAFGKWGDNDGPETYLDIMKSTGSGTKSLIFNSVAKNKYGPILQEPTGKLANTFGAGQSPQPKKYTDNVEEVYQENIRTKKEKPLVDRINQTVGKIIDNIAGNAGIGKEEEDLSPYEFEKPSTTIDDISLNNEYGFDKLPNDITKIDTWDIKGAFPIDFTKGKSPDFDRGTIGTLIPLDVEEEFYPGTIPPGEKNDGRPYNRGMYWSQQKQNPFRRGLLKYTQDLVNNSKVNGQKDKARFIGVVNDPENYESQSGRHKNYSMGNTVTSGEGENTFYCRSWSVRNPYRKVSDLIRHGVNNGTDSLTRPDLNLSVLDNNGFVKVAPYVSDTRGGGITDADGNVTLKLGNPEVQKYMLSIENLAWQNSEHILNVAPCEVGPNGGRIMWFPPYDISFTDNSSINWDATTFIGRGEPIYTYNNTERTGTLSFKVVVDHSMAVTEIKKQGEQALFEYFAGCKDPVEAAIPVLPVTEIEEIKISEQKEVIKIPGFTPPAPPTPPAPVKFYFRNARKFAEDPVGTDLSVELGPNADEKRPNYPNKHFVKWPNGYLRSTIPDAPKFVPSGIPAIPFIPESFTGLTAYTQQYNDSRNEQAVQAAIDLAEFLVTPEGKRFKIKVIGKTSDAGPKKKNEALGLKRANTTKAYLYTLMRGIEATENGGQPVKAENLGSQRTFPLESQWRDDKKRWEVLSLSENDAELSQYRDPETGEVTFFRDENLIFGDADPTASGAVDGRISVIVLEYNPEIDEEFLKDAPKETVEEKITREASTEYNTTVREATQQEAIAQRLAGRASRYLAWECSYFEKMEQDTPFIYETLTEKLKYFHPAFHSMTPEGFNARLTFLKQCTRQGPSVSEDGPSNLAFGKPPICVLRLGDFYHTKIVIDSVNLTFDPLQWDLNPEGIGVQPMVCSVDLNFKFIGGSSLGGPIAQLQNAVGFNFFANTGLYNPRTIFSSVKNYKVTRPDSASGLITELSNEVATPNASKPRYGYGAFLVPGQAIDNGAFVDENSVTTPPVDPSEEKTVQQQADQEIITQEAKQTEEEKQAIEDQFQKKADDRAGAFKIKVVTQNNSDLKNPISIDNVDICQAPYNGSDRGEIKTQFITLQSDQESLIAVEVTTPDGNTYEVTRSESLTKSYPKGIVNYIKVGDNDWKYITLWDPKDRSKSILGSGKNIVGTKANGVIPGTWKFRGVTEIKSSLENEGTTELTKKVYSNPINLKVVCCSNAGGSNNVVFFSDIPENGSC